MAVVRYVIINPIVVSYQFLRRVSTELTLAIFQKMRVFAILLISHIYLSHARRVDGQQDDTVTIQVHPLDIFTFDPKVQPIAQERHPGSSILPTLVTSTRLTAPATKSVPNLHNDAAGFYVIGGTKVERRDYPWIVSIRTRLRGAHLCAGTLIFPKIILTSASCAQKFNAADVAIILGNNDMAAALHQVLAKRVKKIKFHENFSSKTFHNDIALLTLDSEVNNTISFRVASLAVNRTAGGTKATVAGWGNTGYSNMLARYLQAAELDVLTNSDCIAKYSKNRGLEIIQQQLCAGTSGRNSCYGDDGGPLMQNGVVIGVLSYNSDCVLPGVYTRVASYVSWINKNKT